MSVTAMEAQGHESADKGMEGLQLPNKAVFRSAQVLLKRGLAVVWSTRVGYARGHCKICVSAGCSMRIG